MKDPARRPIASGRPRPDSRELRLWAAREPWRRRESVAVLVALLASLPLQLLLVSKGGFARLVVVVAAVVVLRALLRLGARVAMAGTVDRQERVINMEGLVAVVLIWGYPIAMLALFLATTSLSEFLALVRLLIAFTFMPMMAIFILVVALRALLQTPRALFRGAVKTAGSIRGTSLHSTLHQRGYEWLTPYQAGELWQLVGEASFALPPWEMIGTLPGVDQGDLKSVARIVKLLKAPAPR